MLSEFQQELNADKSLNIKHVPHYIRWVRECYSFFRKPLTDSLSPDQTRLFLTQLAVERRAAASTQNQALNAILFLYRHVLDAGGNPNNKSRSPVFLTGGGFSFLYWT